MSAYGSAAPQSIAAGDYQQLINANDVLYQSTPFKSLSVTLGGPDIGAGRRLFVRGLASGAMGSFEVDVQEAWNDVDAEYNTIAVINAAVGTNALGQDIDDVVTGRFFRLYVKTWPNNVTLDAGIGCQP